MKVVTGKEAPRAAAELLGRPEEGQLRTRVESGSQSQQDWAMKRSQGRRANAICYPIKNHSRKLGI